MAPVGEIQVVVGRQHRRDVRSAELAGQLRAAARRHDPAGVDELVRGVEELEPVQKEGPLLRIEQREALVEQHLPDIGFHLGEVGVEGAVEGEVLPEPPAHVAAQLAVRAIVIPAPAQLADAVDPSGGAGCHLEHQPALQPAQADERAALRQKVGTGPDRRRPGVLVARVLHSTQHVDAPGLLVAVLIAQALERNPDLDLVAALVHPAARLEDVIGIEVDVAVERAHAPESAAGRGGAARAPAERRAARAVLLHAERVNAEQERDLPVVVGVEEDLDVIFAADIVAVGVGGADHVAVQLPGDDAEVDRVAPVPDPDFGGLFGGPAVDRLILGEVGEARGLGPGRLVETAVDGDGRVDSGDLHADPPGPAAEAGGVLGGGQDEQRCKEHGAEI